MEWCEWAKITFKNLVIPWNGVYGLTSHSFNNLVIPWNGVNGLTSQLAI